MKLAAIPVRIEENTPKGYIIDLSQNFDYVIPLSILHSITRISPNNTYIL